MGFTKDTMDKIMELISAGYACEQISKMMGIPESTVRSIKNRSEKYFSK